MVVSVCVCVGGGQLFGYFQRSTTVMVGQGSPDSPPPPGESGNRPLSLFLNDF